MEVSTMDTKIVYTVNENWAGVAKGENVKIIGMFDNFVLVEFIKAHEWGILEDATFNEKMKKVTLKTTKNVTIFFKFSIAINSFGTLFNAERFKKAF